MPDRRPNPRWLAPILVSLLAVAAAAQPSETAAFERVLEPWQTDSGPGLAVGVARDGEVLFRTATGRAQLEYDVPIEPDTIFHVASVSKQFTCFAVSLLVEEGKLSWNDDVRKHLSWMPDFGPPIRLHHLAHHTSGLRDQWELLVLAGWRMDDVITEANVLELVARQRELNFPPGTRHLYCNTGYTLLGEVVEAVSGQSLRQFCQERVFEPLGMKRTHFHDDHRHLVPGRAYSYAPAPNGGFQKSVLSYAVTGATSLFTTVDDLLIWNRNFTEARVGSPETLARLVQPGRLADGRPIDYAKGLFNESHRDRRVIGHSGGDAGFRSHLLRFPDERIDVVVLSNRADCPTRGIAFQLADVVLDRELDAEPPESGAGSAPEIPETAPLAPEELRGLTGLYLDTDTGVCWKLSANGSQLQVFSEREARRIVPISDRRFVSVPPGPSFELEFVRGSSAPDRVEIIEAGQSTRTLSRVGPPDRSVESLRELAGDYTSVELDETYHVVLRDKALYLERKKYGAEPLQPRFEDGFTTGWMNIRFLRDPDDRPAEMLISTGRIRNLRFTRED